MEEKAWYESWTVRLGGLGQVILAAIVAFEATGDLPAGSGEAAQEAAGETSTLIAAVAASLVNLANIFQRFRPSAGGTLK